MLTLEERLYEFVERVAEIDTAAMVSESRKVLFDFVIDAERLIEDYNANCPECFESVVSHRYQQACES